MDINNLKNSIDVPTNELNNIIKDSIKRGEKYKYRRKNVRLKKIGGGIAAVFVLVSVIGIMNPKAVSAISAEAVREPAGWISVYGKIPTAESVSAAATVSGAVNGALYAQV